MKDSTKKRMIVVGGLALCVVLVFVIALQFTKEKPTDHLPSSGSSKQAEVVIESGSGSSSAAPDSSSDVSDDSVTAVSQTPSSLASSDAGDSTASVDTEQAIQADPEVPEKPEEKVLTDPSQKPDGTPVEGTPTPEDHDTYQPPEPPSVNTGGGLPGFSDVPNAGENQGGVIDGDGDIDKQVGTMG